MYSIFLLLSHLFQLIFILVSFFELARVFEFVNLMDNQVVQICVKLRIEVGWRNLLKAVESRRFLKDSAVYFDGVVVGSILGHDHLVVVRTLVGVEINQEVEWVQSKEFGFNFLLRDFLI